MIRFQFPISNPLCTVLDAQKTNGVNNLPPMPLPPRLVPVAATVAEDDVARGWRVVSGPGTVARGEDSFGAPDWTATVTATASSGEVVVEARFNEDAIQPRFVLPIVQMRTLPVRAFVVKSDEEQIVTEEDIRRKIDYANVVFSQIGIHLDLLSVSNNVGSASDLVLPMSQAYTNVLGRTYWALSGQATALLNTYSEGDCVELYFVKRVTSTHGRVPAGFQTPLGIVISQRATDHVVAHEIGHALGLEDCYSENDDVAPPVLVASGNDSIGVSFFSNAGRDWGPESGRGFYPADATIRSILSEFAMYGADIGDLLDIPSGAVYSLRKNARSPLQVFRAKVGADYIKSDMTEVYSR